MDKELSPSDISTFILDAVQALSQRPQLPASVPRKIQELLESYLTAQMKILGIVVTVSKQVPNSTRPHGTQVAEQTIRLLQSCPARNVPLRRDLVMILRQMLSSEFRTSFNRHLDFLLDDVALIGKSLCSYENLRDDAIFFLSEFIHGLRTDLTPMQSLRAIHFVIKNMQVCIGSYSLFRALYHYRIQFLLPSISRTIFLGLHFWNNISGSHALPSRSASICEIATDVCRHNATQDGWQLNQIPRHSVSNF